MATIFFLNPKRSKWVSSWSIISIEERCRKQFGLFFDKTETGKVESLRMHHSILAFILKFWRKASRLQTTVACLFSSKIT